MDRFLSEYFLDLTGALSIFGPEKGLAVPVNARINQIWDFPSQVEGQTQVEVSSDGMIQTPNWGDNSMLKHHFDANDLPKLAVL